MRKFSYPVAAWILCVFLPSCVNALGSAGPPPFTPSTTPAQIIHPTQGMIPTEYPFSTPLIQQLSRAGVRILAVQGSAYQALFASTDQAVWIKTDQGIVEAVFFMDPAESEQIHVVQQPDRNTGRYMYQIRASPPARAHDQTIDAAFPLYFTVDHGMFIVTGSAELDKTLKRILAER